MTDQPRMAHLVAERLLDYFEGSLPEDEQRRIEEHVAECDSCALLARNVSAFNGAWEWTAEEHGALHQRAQLSRALEAAQAVTPSLADRLRRWRQDWAGSAEAALRIAVQTSAATVGVIAQGVDALTRSGGEWRFSVIEPPPAARGVARSDSTSALLVATAGAEGPRARVAIRGGESTEVEARIDGLLPDAPAPIVLLISLEPNETVRVQTAEAKVRPGARYGIARFRNLDPGEYVVAFEPMAEHES